MKRKMSSNDLCNNNFASHGSDFLFGFNDRRFSDRELIIEILPDDATNPSGDLQSAENDVEGSRINDPICSQECSNVIKLHVSSLLLAAKSPFFSNMFTNGMMESEQRCVTMRIHANEEAAFMEILKYMYSGELTVQTAPALVDVLKLADKFQVVSCMRLCARLLKKLPMSTESAFLYLDLTSTLPMADEVRLLADAAKQFLAAQYKDMDKVWNEIMEIPLAGVEAILSSDVLRVSSEDNLFCFALRWAETHYPKLEDQRKILSDLARYIRFPYMSLEKLREVLSCDSLDRDFAYETVIDALFFKITNPHHHRTKSATEGSIFTSHTPFVRRNYRRWPVKVMEFAFPCRELVVYGDLMFDEFANLKPSEKLKSETFNICGQPYFLYALRTAGPQNCSYFSVNLGSDVDVDEHSPLAIEYEFAVRSRLTKKFVMKSGGSCDFPDKYDLTMYMGPWVNFVVGKSLESIDGIAYLEVKLRIRQ